MQDTFIENIPQDKLIVIDKPVRRRERKSGGIRNYFCGCGRTYLSYPALYTHARNKHNGIFPEGTFVKNRCSDLEVTPVLTI